MVLKVQTGSGDEWGKPKTKSLSWSGIDPAADADAVDAAADALAGLCLYPRNECRSWPPTS
jgi:hypothetical protein